jgi:hypothetical protein
VKFKEDHYLIEIEDYISKTYREHYAGKGGTQTFDVIASSGLGIGFCLGSIIKYSTRFGKKAGWNRNDLLKLIHYAILALYVFDIENDKIGEIK